MILYSEGATKSQEDEANAIIEALNIAYPGHPWMVRVYDGGFFIRHLDFDKNWGMNCRHTTKLYSASAMKREVIRMAGEWLERANLKRGRANEDPTVRVEGVPEKYQPIEYREPQKEVVVEGELRNEPRGQVKELEKENGDRLRET